MSGKGKGIFELFLDSLDFPIPETSTLAFILCRHKFYVKQTV